jgi:hypothetical protein
MAVARRAARYLELPGICGERRVRRPQPRGSRLRARFARRRPQSLHRRIEHGHGQRNIPQISVRWNFSKDAFRCSRSTTLCCRSSKPSSSWDYSNTPTSTNRISTRCSTIPRTSNLARTAVQRSIVLLRNQGALLPLDKSGKTIRSIAVIGPLGDAQQDILSMWGAMTKPGPTVSVVQGIQDKVGPAIHVAYAHGPNAAPRQCLRPSRAFP